MDTLRVGPTGRPLPPSEGVQEAGLLSGLFGGLSMGLFLMIVWAATGQGFWKPVELVSGTFIGLGAVVGGFWAGVLGWALHLSVAAAWGTLFAALVSRETTRGQALWAGLLYGVGVWAVMTYVGLPVLNRTMEPRVNVMAGWWFTAHLIYGACLYRAPELRRVFTQVTHDRRDARRERERLASGTRPR